MTEKFIVALFFLTVGTVAGALFASSVWTPYRDSSGIELAIGLVVILAALMAFLEKEDRS